jgi:hypothetical protein
MNIIELERSEGFSQQNPYISVILFDYVNHNFTVDSVNSIICQDTTPDNFELVVLTDHENPEYINCLKSSSINYLVIYTGLITIGESFAVAVRLSRGEILTFLDNDDIYFSDRVEKIMRAFRATDNIGFLKNEVRVLSRERKIDSLGFEYFLRMNIPVHCSGKLWVLGDDSPQKILGRSLLHNSSSMAIKKIILERFTEEISKIIMFPDSFLFFAGNLSGEKSVFLDECLTGYFVNRKSRTRSDFERDGQETSWARIALEYEESIFSLRVNNSNSRYIKDQFLLLLIRTKMLMSLRGDDQTAIDCKDLIRTLLISIHHRSHNMLFLITVYLLYKFGV